MSTIDTLLHNAFKLKTYNRCILVDEYDINNSTRKLYRITIFDNIIPENNKII